MPYRPPSPFDLHWLLQFLRVSGRTVARVHAADDRYRCYSEHLSEVVECLSSMTCSHYERIPHFPIHGDWNRNNIVRRGPAVAGVLDFGNSHVGTAVADIASFILNECVVCSPEPT